MRIFAMSDLHGDIAAFEYALSLIDLTADDAKLVLLGDYIHGGSDSYAVLDKIMTLESNYGKDKIIALKGNHEDMAIWGKWHINNTFYDTNKDLRYLSWLSELPLYYVDCKTIFVHAGIDEDASGYWADCTGENTFLCKYPAETGKIEGIDMKVVAGHIGTYEISGNQHFHDIYFDGKSHYYIDGTVRKSGIIPVLMVDTETDKYYRVTESGYWIIEPYSEEQYT